MNLAIAIIERLVDGGRCKFDVLNPCFDNRPHDVPGKHADGTDACAYCTARAFLSTHNSCVADQIDQDEARGLLSADEDAKTVLSFAYKAPLTSQQEEFLNRVSDTLYPQNKEQDDE